MFARKRALLLLILLLALGAIYIETLLPGVGHSGDTAKFQFVGYVLGTPHATGYPSYVLLNHIFTRLMPFGSVAYRANLMSAIFACGASLFLFGILHELHLDDVVAVSAALIFGLTRAFWQNALYAEVYSLHLLFMTSVLYFLLRWSNAGRRSDFILACGLYSFSFGNHLLTIMLIPAFAIFVWLTDRRVLKDRRCIAWAAGLILLGAAQYLYFPWRTHDPSTAYLEMHARDWRSFLWFVTGGQFRGGMFAYTPAELLWERIPFFLGETWRQFGALLLVLPLPFIASHKVRVHALLVAYFCANAAYVLNYRIPDIEAYFLPNYLVIAVYIGMGLNVLLESTPPKIRSLTLAVILAMPVFLLATNWGAVNQHGKTAKVRETTAMLEEVGADSVIVSDDYNIFEYLMYYDLAEGWLEKGVFVSHDFDIPDIILYLRGEGELRATAQPVRIPPGLKVYGAGLRDRHLEALREAGLHVEVIRGGLLYRILSSTDGD